MRVFPVLCALLVACGTSSTSAPASDAGTEASAANCGTHACDPELDAHFFDGAKITTDLLVLYAPPCPKDYAPTANSLQLGAGAPVQRLTSEGELLNAFCQASSGANDAGAAVDFATSDVVVIGFESAAGGATVFDVAGQRWVTRNASSGCGGVQMGPHTAFFVVPKALEIHVQSCYSTCVYGGECGPAPP
jgi:hypothetical protein